MNFKKLLILFTLLISTYSLAEPKNVEVWFLSVDKVSFLNRYTPQIKFSKQLADNRICQPMGEYCFDPQIGLYKRDDKGVITDSPNDYTELDQKNKYDRLDGYKDGEFKTCDNNGNFDIFCGKTKAAKVAANIKAEFWIDASSSMKQVDFEGHNSSCQREYFMKQIGSKCPLNQKMKIYTFNETRREMGAYNQLCMNVGLNRTDRIIESIKKNKSDYLLIITDIYEATSEFVDYVQGLPGGTVRGVEKPMYASDLKKYIGDIQSKCL